MLSVKRKTGEMIWCDSGFLAYCFTCYTYYSLFCINFYVSSDLRKYLTGRGAYVISWQFNICMAVDKAK